MASHFTYLAGAAAPDPARKRKRKGEKMRRRNKSITIRFSEDEFTEFRRKYEQSKLPTQSDFILSLLRDKQILVIDGLPELITELRREGNNINQIAKNLNRTGSMSQDIETAIEEWRQLLVKLKELVCRY